MSFLITPAHQSTFEFAPPGSPTPLGVLPVAASSPLTTRKAPPPPVKPAKPAPSTEQSHHQVQLQQTHETQPQAAAVEVLSGSFAPPPPPPPLPSLGDGVGKTAAPAVKFELNTR